MEPFEVYPSDKRTQFTRVRDTLGNEYICAVEALKNLGQATQEELMNCIDESKTPHPFAGG
ncbi:MAG: hypothetical protein WAW37_03085 [Syntrophobacteraceae bacterium]